MTKISAEAATLVPMKTQWWTRTWWKGKDVLYTATALTDVEVASRPEPRIR